jgi:hypothetical protein
MISKLMTATAIVLVSGGLAVAQTASGTTGTTTGAAGSSSEAAGFQWDQSAQDAFFNDGSLRSDEELRAAFDAMDSEKQAALRADCQQFASAGSATGGATGGTSGSTDTAASADTSSNTSGGATGSSSDMAAGSGAAGTDSTATSSTTGGTGSAGGSAAGDTSATAAPDMASMEQLCSKVQSY